MHWTFKFEVCVWSVVTRFWQQRQVLKIQAPNIDFGHKNVTKIYCLSIIWRNNLKFIEHINQISLFKILILPPILLPLGLCCPGCLHHHLTTTRLYMHAISGAVSVFTAGPQIRCSLLWHWHDSCSLICGAWGTDVFHCYCVCEACCLLWPLSGLIYTVRSNGLHTSNYLQYGILFVANKSVYLTCLNMDWLLT